MHYNVYNVHCTGTSFERHFKARGGSRGKKCHILIFQYVIELEKTNKMQKREVNLTSPYRDIVPQRLRFTYNCIGSLNFKSPYLWIVFSTSAPLPEERVRSRGLKLGRCVP